VIRFVCLFDPQDSRCRILPKPVARTSQASYHSQLFLKVSEELFNFAKLKLWIRAVRAPFFQAVFVPAILGTVVAWQQTGLFNLWYFVLVLAGVIFIHAGTNLANDYYDHKTRADDINTQPTPFSGGSRLIQQGLISAGSIYKAAVVFFAFAIIVGLYLVWLRGWYVLALGLVGVLSGYFYTAQPIKIGYRGFGEFLVGFNCGPLVVLGAYYVQTGAFALGALIASVPVGLLIAAVLYINEFADYGPDKQAKKNTLIVLMGIARAIKGYYVLVFGSYFFIALAVIAGVIPWPCLISVITFPLALKAVRTASANYNDPNRLIPAMAGTIIIHLSIGLLLSLGYLLAGVFLR